jgi:hypothetical protein
MRAPALTEGAVIAEKLADLAYSLEAIDPATRVLAANVAAHILGAEGHLAPFVAEMPVELRREVGETAAALDGRLAMDGIDPAGTLRRVAAWLREGER